MAAVTVTETIKVNNAAVPGVRVSIKLVASTTDDDAPAYVTTLDYTIADVHTTVTDATGIWSASLEPNTLITPANTTYRIDYKYPGGGKPGPTYISVPSTAGPHRVEDILSTAPSALAPAGFGNVALAGDVTGTISATTVLTASTTQAGKAELATTAETITGTDTARVITPAGLQGFNVGSAIYYATKYGVTADGTTDDTTALQAVFDAAEATGGTIILPAGTIKLTAKILITNDGATPPRQMPIRVQGAGADQRGAAVSSNAPIGGTILNFTAATGVGCIDTRGDGMLEITGVTFNQNGTAHAIPYIHTTNTTLKIHECSFCGHLTKFVSACNQDAIVLGGTTANLDGSDSAAFQGYGTVIQNNWFNRIRRLVYFRTYANGVVVRDNTAWWQCGGSAAIELDGGPDNCGGNVISGNLIEMSGYTYGILAAKTIRSTFGPNNFFDAISGTYPTAFVRLETTSQYNLVISGIHTGVAPFVTDVGGTNTIITAAQSEVTKFPQPVTMSNTGAGAVFSGKATFSGGNNLMVVQPAADTVEGAKLILVKRSAVDDTNPDGEVWSVTQGGSMQATDSAGASVAWSSGGKTWASTGAGGQFLIYTGTGGSPIVIKAGAHVFQYYDATELVRIRLDGSVGTRGAIQFNGTSGAQILTYTASPQGAIAAAVGSICTNVNGGTGTTLYVKETGGATSTGWVAK